MTGSLSEFELIHRFFRERGAARNDVIIGVGDDAAVTRVPEGCELVSTVDVLVCGVHFAESADPADVGYKCLAVNLSDMAAMGADPAWATLALTLPAADTKWLAAFADGFAELARAHGVALVGGDTVRGSLQLAVQLLGWVPEGQALTRSGAAPGDGVYVTGSLGDAALALEGGTSDEKLRRPEPRVAAGKALRGVASACIDVSDGLAADLGHIIAASNAGATLQLQRLPASAEVAALDDRQRWSLQTGGGDDYELCFTAPADAERRIDEISAQLDLAMTRVGVIDTQSGVRLLDADGNAWTPDRAGYQHFQT